MLGRCMYGSRGATFRDGRLRVSYMVPDPGTSGTQKPFGIVEGIGSAAGSALLFGLASGVGMPARNLEEGE